ncbi:hypothetical protein BLNAU_13090 [Blattamonas nauphoetae]|uniref:Uncharacterized protein n=1 Tax=Blattamonas nauphoetae TaxID=2049346 RepID=A0ABQ9XLA9_9EUKA|nr:hypothetical protein BLNAU_13090 [Blattamonas nauphoetae]
MPNTNETRRIGRALPASRMLAESGDIVGTEWGMSLTRTAIRSRTSRLLLHLRILTQTTASSTATQSRTITEVDKTMIGRTTPSGDRIGGGTMGGGGDRTTTTDDTTTPLGGTIDGTIGDIRTRTVAIRRIRTAGLARGEMTSMAREGTTEVRIDRQVRAKDDTATATPTDHTDQTLSIEWWRTHSDDRASHLNSHLHSSSRMVEGTRSLLPSQRHTSLHRTRTTSRHQHTTPNRHSKGTATHHSILLSTRRISTVIRSSTATRIRPHSTTRNTGRAPDKECITLSNSISSSPHQQRLALSLQKLFKISRLNREHFFKHKFVHS